MNSFSAEKGKDGIPEAVISRCHGDLVSRYPELRVRWCRIYGKRRAHLMGSRTEISYTARYISLDDGYELCLENPEILPEDELKRIREFVNNRLNCEGRY